MKTITERLAQKMCYLSLGLLALSCSTDEQEIDEVTLSAIKTQELTYSDFQIAERYAPNFYQDVDAYSRT